MFKSFADKAKSLTDKYAINEKFAAAGGTISSNLAAANDAVSANLRAANAAISTNVAAAGATLGTQLEAGSAIATEMFDHHWPKIEPIVVNGLISFAEDRLRDDELLKMAFEKIYELLPTPFRLVVPRQRFLEYSMSHREPLLLKMNERRRPAGA